MRWMLPALLITSILVGLALCSPAPALAEDGPRGQEKLSPMVQLTMPDASDDCTNTERIARAAYLQVAESLDKADWEPKVRVHRTLWVCSAELVGQDPEKKKD